MRFGSSLKRPPLRFVGASEVFRAGTHTGALQLDVADEQAVHGDAEIRTPVNIVGMHLGTPVHVTNHRADSLDQVANERLKLVFGISVNGKAEVLSHFVGVLANGLGEYSPAASHVGFSLSALSSC